MVGGWRTDRGMLGPGDGGREAGSESAPKDFRVVAATWLSDGMASLH